MRTRRRFGIVLTLLAVGLASCGGDGESDPAGAPPTTGDAVETTAPTTTTPTEAAPTQSDLPSGVSVSYPSDWTSYGIGFSGSLELNIPGVANVSLRDAAASEYLYGPMLPEQETLEGAFEMFAFGMGTAEIGPAALTSVDGREILAADVVNGGNAGLMAVMELGGSFASVYAESPTDALPEEAIEAVLRVLASMTP